MTRRLIIECGVAETRAALLVDGKLWKLWFGPARGDEGIDAYPLAGRKFAGRVKRIDRSLSAAFVDIGDDFGGFLSITTANAQYCIEGAMLLVEVKSSPRQKKSAVLRFVEPLTLAVAPGRLAPFSDPALEAVQELGPEFDDVVVDDGRSKRLLAESGVQNVSHDNHRASLFARLQLDTQFHAAFLSHVPLLGGGALTIEEAQALTSIDVDTGGLTASSSARLREKIAIAAASEAVRQISLRNIGGHVVIDFPKIKGDSGRKRLQKHLPTELSKLDKISAAGFSKSGVFTFVAPHRASSLIERFTEEMPCEPLAGRRFKLEFLAKRAIGELESQLRAAPSGRFELAVGEGLDAFLHGVNAWGERLRDKYGSRFEIECDANCGGRSYELKHQ